ncbi:unnamed protein product [Linum trigynum]|uniref:Reverse transcriptase n=1 Tax=Linum trigynum TaxID=586398 RepID=A0AAV2CLQ6_9ROSI
MIGRSKKVVFQHLQERVRSKLTNWKSRYFSDAGKEILIKSTAQAQATYAMSVFRIPEGIIDDLHKLMANYWWGQKRSERRIHWKIWEKLCKRKEEGGMGFRDLRIFNKAMLAKQLWNLHTRPDSLVARLIKAKYHPRTTILEAKVGWRPSYIWRSLMWAQDLLKAGCRWRIGSGEEVRIWGDRWVPNLENYEVFSYCPFLEWDARVSSLIDQDSRTWRQDLLEIIFTPEERQAILAIPLSSNRDKDVLCWMDTKNGKYTVKSGYFFEQKREEEEAGNDISNRVEFCWKKLWKVRMPGKLKTFIWKAAHDILPVGAKISRKVRNLGDECLNCGLKETLKHCLVDCSWNSRIWSKTPLAEMFYKAEGLTCKQWLAQIINSYPDKEVAQLCSLLWFFWKDRNNFLFNKKFLDEWQVFPRADEFIHCFLEVQGKNKPSPRTRLRSACKWKKPPIGVFKLNTDAGISNERKVGLGCILRDWEGKEVFAASRRLNVNWSPDIAEGMAILYGIRLVKEKGIGPIVVESDCKRVIEKLKQEEICRTELGTICSDILKEAEELDIREWSFAFREAYNAAHMLAHLVSEFEENRFECNGLPLMVADVVALEASDS